jgi:4-hydroxy-2-oxoheptanedioate aldolase
VPRVNRAIELIEQGQPVYYTGPTGGGRGYEAGKESAGTWADYINYDMEHGPFDVATLREFMRGLVDGGPTRSGHRTPAVVVTLPMDAINEDVIRSNSWVLKQLLASGVHGLLLCHAESPDAVRAFVEYCRYPFNTTGVGKGLQVGRRGGGGQQHAAQIWGLEVRDYLAKADPWPLNPQGELFLGLKIENVRALSNVEASLRVPGIAFAEWGPGDMGMSMGHPDAHDPPYPAEMQDARARVLAACKANDVKFLNAVRPQEVVENIDEGVMVCAAGRGGDEAARIGRAHTKRTMPV